MISQQKFEYVCLDKAKDILTDELEQAMVINENITNEQNLDKIYKFKCSNCITTQLLRGNDLFDIDSDEEKKDQLSESLPDKNKLSKSEKSLKVPLHMFQEEQRQSNQTGSYNLG